VVVAASAERAASVASHQSLAWVLVVLQLEVWVYLVEVRHQIVWIVVVEQVTGLIMVKVYLNLDVVVVVGVAALLFPVLVGVGVSNSRARERVAGAPFAAEQYGTGGLAAGNGPGSGMPRLRLLLGNVERHFLPQVDLSRAICQLSSRFRNAATRVSWLHSICLEHVC